MPTKCAPRIDNPTAELLPRQFGTVNAGAEYVLGAWPNLYRRAIGELRGVFTRAELMLVLDVANSLYLTPGLAGQHLPLSIADGIALDNLDKKWTVAGEEINGKIRDLTSFQAAAIEIWARAAWNNSDNDPKFAGAISALA